MADDLVTRLRQAATASPHAPPGMFAEPDVVALLREAADALEAVARLIPQIDESLTNDTLYDDALSSEPCECEDCGRLRIDALKAVRGVFRA